MNDHVGDLGEVEFDAVEDLAGAGELEERIDARESIVCAIVQAKEEDV